MVSTSEMVETIGGKIHAFIESVKYGCVVLSCMFVNRDNGESW
jgi:hypothetical protein